jgi:predicted ATPase
MIESIEFRNFKVLREATLRLGRFNLLVGPNGSGKSTVLAALRMAAEGATLPPFGEVASSGTTSKPVSVTIHFSSSSALAGIRAELKWDPGAGNGTFGLGGEANYQTMANQFRSNFCATRIYSLDAAHIAAPVEISPSAELSPEGGNLAGLLDRIHNAEPDRWESLNEEIGRLLPEYDRILFDVPGTGQKSVLLRTRFGGHRIPARDLSQGTLFALALLTLVYAPHPPPIVCLEEPDRGIHPRLLRDVRDALYRLCYPENYGEKREPVQVIATTHSPYMLDLYREHPEEVIISQKDSSGATFERLSDREDLDEIIGDAHLGDVWYSGILGGVPATR